MVAATKNKRGRPADRGWPIDPFFAVENTGSMSRVRKRAFMKMGDLAQYYLSDEEADRIIEENRKKPKEFGVKRFRKV